MHEVELLITSFKEKIVQTPKLTFANAGKGALSPSIQH